MSRAQPPSRFRRPVPRDSGPRDSAPNRTILVTAFEPFGGHGTNSSKVVVEALASRPIKGVTIRTLVLPVEFDRAWNLLRRELARRDESLTPLHALVLTGMAARADRVRLEKVALNVRDCESLIGRRPRPRPDNGGRSPVDRPVVKGAPLALATDVDVRCLARVMRSAGRPVEVSWSAGVFVCNDLYYRALLARGATGAHDRTRRDSVRIPPTLFVHLPALLQRSAENPTGRRRAGLPSSSMVATLRGIVRRLSSMTLS